MGAVASFVTAVVSVATSLWGVAAGPGTWALCFAYIAGFSIFLRKRDDLSATTELGSNLVVKPIEPILISDADFISAQHLSMVSWDHVGGEMVWNWSPTPTEQNGNLHGFFPRCVGFNNNSRAVDAEGNTFALDYWTPNGSAEISLPSGKFVQGKWLKEISEDDVWDCRDRYDELLSTVPRPMPKVLTAEQELEIQQAKELKLLHACDLEAWRKALKGELALSKKTGGIPDVKCDHQQNKRAESALERRSALLTSHFSVLPADAAALPKYTAEGTRLLIELMKVDDTTGKDQARMLHSAMSTILGAHYRQKRSMMRFVRRDTAPPPHDVMHAMVDAVVDAANMDDKKWTQMLAIGAVSRTARESAQAGRGGERELQIMDRIFSRFD